MITKGQVKRVTFRGDQVDADLHEVTTVGPSDLATNRIETLVPRFGDPSLLVLLEEKGVDIKSLPHEPSGLTKALVSFLPWVFQL